MILDYIDIIFWPLIASFVLTGIHVYLGLHVVTRGVIFVDLALAQVAALGTSIGILMGLGHDSVPTYIIALGFTFLGATLFAITRSKKEKVPQEAIIGITYVVTAALMILLFSKSPEGAEHLNHLLVGSILFVSPKIVGITFLLYASIGILHWIYRKQFFAISNGETISNHRFWDFIFYMSFGFVVTSSVKIAGVLLVFSFLIIPAVSALLFVNGKMKRLIFGWGFGILGSVLGMIFSLIFDIPTGASIVVTFGGLLIIFSLFKLILKR
jgi:zinc/manganese transport system permease protein